MILLAIAIPITFVFLKVRFGKHPVRQERQNLINELNSFIKEVNKRKENKC